MKQQKRYSTEYRERAVQLVEQSHDHAEFSSHYHIFSQARTGVKKKVATRAVFVTTTVPVEDWSLRNDRVYWDLYLKVASTVPVAPGLLTLRAIRYNASGSSLT